MIETKKLDDKVELMISQLAALLDCYYERHPHEEIFGMDNEFANALDKVDEARQALITARFVLVGSKL